MLNKYLLLFLVSYCKTNKYPNFILNHSSSSSQSKHNMCMSIDYPNEDRNSFTITDLDFDELIPIRENTMLVTKTKKTKHKLKLENIPEETELYVDNDNKDTHSDELEEACNHLEMDLQVLRKSLDMGLCVLCLGVGFMVSTKFRPRPKFSSFLSASSLYLVYF
jgi:hypothetical protein